MHVCSRPVVLCNKISLSMMGERVYSVAGARAWNTLLADVRDIQTHMTISAALPAVKTFA